MARKKTTNGNGGNGASSNGGSGSRPPALPPLVSLLQGDPLEDELTALFQTIRGGTYEERMQRKLALLKVAMEQCGITKQTTDAVINRAAAINGTYAFKEGGKSDRALATTLRERLTEVLNFVDPVILAQTGGRDLAIMIGILIEKMNLLEGKPTSINLNIDERRHFNNTLIPALIQEAERRGYVIEASPQTFDTELKEATYVPVDRD